MSKKKTKKFKKAKSVQPSTNTFVSSDPVLDDEAVTTNSTSESEIITEAAKSNDPYSNNQYDHVKKDIKKLVGLIGIICIVFAGIYILGLKTNVLTSFGDWIYKVTNIQTQ